MPLPREHAVLDNFHVRKTLSENITAATPLVYTIETLRTVTGGAINRSRAYLLIATGELEARKLGRLTVVTGDSVLRYLAALPAAQMPAPVRDRAGPAA